MAVAQGSKLTGDPGQLLLGSGKLGSGCFERCLGDPALGAHRRLPSEQVGERRFGFPRNCLDRREVGRDPRCLSFRVTEPYLEIAPLLLELLDAARCVSFQRLLATDVARQCAVEPVELCDPPGHGFTTRPCCR